MLAFTMDTDWAPPEVVEFVLDEVVDDQLALTVFSTGRYSVLESRPATEVALHYNVEEVGFERSLRQIADLLPGAIGARGHSLAFSERLRPLYREFGIAYDSSYLMFEQHGIEPFYVARGVWELPIFFMDAFFLEYHEGRRSSAPNQASLLRRGLKVLDFHPVHLLLNTPSLEYYHSVKQHYQDFDALMDHRFQGWGMRVLFEEIQSWALAINGGRQTLGELVTGNEIHRAMAG